jgi:hypothetical protein
MQAIGRIELPLLDGGRSSTPSDLRPSLATTLYHKKLQMFLSATKGRSPVDRELRPLIDAGAPRTGELLGGCERARPTGGRYVRTARGPAQRGEGAKLKAAPGTKGTQRGQGQYRGRDTPKDAPARQIRVLIL